MEETPGRSDLGATSVSEEEDQEQQTESVPHFATACLPWYGKFIICDEMVAHEYELESFLVLD